MRQEFVNPLLAPPQKVWQTEFKLDLKIKSARAVFYQHTTEDITAIIGVSGRLAGNVLYGFGEKSSLSICEWMIGPGVNPHDPLALSALGETANIITGDAATQVAANGYQCDIAPPVITEPRASTTTCSVPSQILVHFTSDLADLSVRTGLAENAKHQARAA